MNTKYNECFSVITLVKIKDSRKPSLSAVHGGIAADFEHFQC